jgi:hypothetical protein
MNLEQIMTILQIIKAVTNDSDIWVEIFPDGSGHFSTLDKENDKTLFSFSVDFSGFYKNLGEFLAK